MAGTCQGIIFPGNVLLATTQNRGLGRVSTIVQLARRIAKVATAVTNRGTTSPGSVQPATPPNRGLGRVSIIVRLVLQIVKAATAATNPEIIIRGSAQAATTRVLGVTQISTTSFQLTTVRQMEIAASAILLEVRNGIVMAATARTR